MGIRHYALQASLAGALLLHAGCPSTNGAHRREQNPTPSSQPVQKKARSNKAAPKKEGGRGAGKGSAKRVDSPRRLEITTSARMFRSDPARLGRAPGTIPRRRPRVAWRHATKRAVFASPAVDDLKNVYVGSVSGELIALDRHGKLRWKKTLSRSIYSSAALLENLVIVGSDDEHLRAYSLANGTPRWSLRLGPCRKLVGHGMDRIKCQADGSPLVVNDRIYFAADAIYALDKRGRLLWRFPLEGHALSSVASIDNMLVVGTQANLVVAVGTDGKPLWQRKTPTHCDGTPALVAGRAYIGCDDGRLRALQLKDGRMLWSVRTWGVVRGSAAVSHELTLDNPTRQSELIVFGSYDRFVRAVDRDGKKIWAYHAKGAIGGSPAVDRRTVVFGARDGKIHALDLKTGRLLWTLALGHEIDSSVTVTKDGALLVGCDDGYLYRLEQP
jgi:outer membrane protein assembly factor BamB